MRRRVPRHAHAPRRAVSLNFIDNSRVGPAIATARIVRAGRTIVVASVDVADAGGKVLVTSTFTYVPMPSAGRDREKEEREQETAPATQG